MLTSSFIFPIPEALFRPLDLDYIGVTIQTAKRGKPETDLYNDIHILPSIVNSGGYKIYDL